MPVKSGRDEVFDYEGIVCDRKSMLYLYGLMLDHKDAMIGGFHSPTPMPHKPAAAVIHLVFITQLLGER